jgi:hypothetical protein
VVIKSSNKNCRYPKFNTVHEDKCAILPYMKNTPVGEFSTTIKIQALNQLPSHDRMGEKLLSRYCPFKEAV